MPLETGITDSSTPDDLNKDWPLGSDPKSEGDDQIRNTKHVLKNFYRDLAFDKLPLGALVSVFNGRFDESGIRTKNGGLDMELPSLFQSLFVTDFVNNLPSPIPYTPLGSNSAPVHYKTDVFQQTDLQPVDTETSSAPIAFTYNPPADAFASRFTFRGAGTTTSDVRITVKETDVNGRLLFRTASDQELRSGGGFTLAATGDTLVLLPQLWSKVLGRAEYVTFDRYDSGTDTIVSTGITLKGATIASEFNPYVKIEGYPYTIVNIQEQLAGAFITEIGYIENAVDTPILVATTLASLPSQPLVLGKTYRWRVEVLADHVATNDSFADIELLIGGIAVDHDGSGFLGQAGSRAITRNRSVNFAGRFTEATGGNVNFELRGTIGAGTIIALRSTITVEQVG